jgi:predicted CXXCH cytochrome family protein
MTKQATARFGGILAGAGVLFVGGVLIASSPALADNGPHISNAGTTAIGAGPDGCAGCHRIHSAKSDNGMLLVNASETALCETCHQGGAGATTDVVNGVQYQAPTGGALTSPLQALRGGGFTNAMIGAGAATRAFTATGGIDNTQSLVPVGAGEGTTSDHGLGSPTTMWGSGAISSAGNVGSAVTLECGSCHDPHGNGNYRILRPVGSLGAQTIKTSMAVTTASAVADTVNAGKFVWTFTFAANPGFVPGQPVAISNMNPAGYNFAPSMSCTATRCSWTQANIGSVSASAPWTISIPGMTGNPGAYVSGGLVSTALPNTISLVSGAGTGTLTFNTFINHGLSTGQKVTISGALPADYNLINVPITVTARNSFTVASAVTATYSSGGFISGIPDSLPVASPTAGYTSVGVNQKVYNTLNYWRADDHFYTGAYSAVGTSNPSPNNNAGGVNSTDGESAFIINASQWCTTCHTRYLTANSTSRKFSSGDAVFTFRHTGGAYKENSPDCMQCHVAHGSNAAMTGLYSGNLAVPAVPPATGATSADSRLLRVDNRGTCIFCHNM